MEKRINTLLNEVLGTPVVSLTRVHGGSIAASYRALLQDSTSVFVKIDAQHPAMFTREAEGLNALAASQTIRIPSVIHADSRILILEWIETRQIFDRKTFFRTFGTQFAALHRTVSTEFGFSHDNFIGSTLQPNTPRELIWTDFFSRQRLQFQYSLAKENGHATKELCTLIERCIQLLPLIIGENNEPPTLLHGDLWGGNYLCDTNEKPVLIDPAAYFGNREADLAMTLLFGGFDRIFYDAYRKEYPLNDGFENRMELYKLYNLLNHLNLFGGGYYSQVIGTLRSILSDFT